MKVSLSKYCIYTSSLSFAFLRPTCCFYIPSHNHWNSSPPPPTETSSKKQTALFYYKPNLPLSSRLSEIKSELSTLQSRGIDKFLLDEIAAAQKRLSSDVQTAEKYADGIVKKGRGEEGRIMREAMKSSGNEESVTALVNGLKGVRQELEEIKGVKALGVVAEETMKNDLLLEKDLQSVTEKVASTLNDAEMAIKSSVATLSSGEISDDDKERVLKQFDATIASLQQSIQTSNTIANSIKKTTYDSFSVLERITQTRHDLMDAMEDTEDTIGFIAERHGNRGDEDILSEGAKSLFDVIDNTGSAAYETVKQVEAVEELANVLTTKVATETDAILSLNKNTYEAVLESLQAAKNVVREFTSDSDVAKLLTGYANRINLEGESVKQLVDAIQSDISRDASALEVVKNANVKIQALLDVAENQLEMSKRAIFTGDTVDPKYVEQNIVDVKSALVAILDATKVSAESAVQKFQQSIAETKETHRIAVEYGSIPSVEKTTEGAVQRGNMPVADQQDKSMTSEHRIESEVKAKEDGEAVEEEKSVQSVQNTEQSAVKTKEDGGLGHSENSEPIELETKGEADTVESAQKGEAHTKEEGDANEAKDEAAPRSLESSVTTEKADEEISIETTETDKSTSSESGDVVQSLAPKPGNENVENTIKHSDGVIVQLGEKSPSSQSVLEISDMSSTSDNPTDSDIVDLSKTPSMTEHTTIENHPDLVSGAQEATELVNLKSIIPVDIGEMGASSSELVHEFANAAFNAVDVVHDLVYIVATSLV